MKIITVTGLNMKYCNTCKKNVPTVSVGNTIECAICGTEIQKKSSSYVNRATDKAIKELLEKDNDTGVYKSAQSLGKGVLIGLLLIAAGVLYIFGGIPWVIGGIVFFVAVFVIVTIIIYFYLSYKKEKK
jgi:hypothetical protein